MLLEARWWSRVREVYDLVMILREAVTPGRRYVIEEREAIRVLQNSLEHCDLDIILHNPWKSTGT